ncbi:3-beta hydroxysteroid dehydrogenase/isomerase [Mycena epipterygia]|nr:3-beta hydroxysteroid dehydrogenase/isomerase [Mycena epipterygia]
MEGSIVDPTRILKTIEEIKPLIVLHTASPVHGLHQKIYYEVNETGTRNVIAACRAAGVKKLIYTSSTGIVWTGPEFNGISKTQVGFPSKGYDTYQHTKSLGERLILMRRSRQSANCHPSSLWNDRQLIWRLAEVYEKKQYNMQIGDNTKLVDYAAYVRNVAHAHVLAWTKLISQPELVYGQAFIITNGEPVPQWDFARLIWKELGDDGKG